ncbi:hypothetical protein [Streptomyces zaomyceticus]|uniref:hypothetical protein n=1 Tax=Streptomyces zaomyceticus TaxID=68286 RepID=UPI00342AB75B
MTLFLAVNRNPVSPYDPDSAVVCAPSVDDATDFAVEALGAKPGDIAVRMLRHPGPRGVVVAGFSGSAAHVNS